MVRAFRLWASLLNMKMCFVSMLLLWFIFWLMISKHRLAYNWFSCNSIEAQTCYATRTTKFQKCINFGVIFFFRCDYYNMPDGKKIWAFDVVHGDTLWCALYRRVHNMSIVYLSEQARRIGVYLRYMLCCVTVLVSCQTCTKPTR